MYQSKPGIEFLPPHQIIGKRWEGIILKMMREMLDAADCRQSFSDSSYTKISLQKVWEKGIIIGSGTLLTDWSYSDEQVKLPKQWRIETWRRLQSDSAITAVPSSDTPDQRPRIYFGLDSMSSFIQSTECRFRECLVHELIHCAGVVGKKPGWIWEKLGYKDLDYMGEDYKNIIRACGCK